MPAFTNRFVLCVVVLSTIHIAQATTPKACSSCNEDQWCDGRDGFCKQQVAIGDECIGANLVGTGSRRPVCKAVPQGTYKISQPICLLASGVQTGVCTMNAELGEKCGSAYSGRKCRVGWCDNKNFEPSNAVCIAVNTLAVAKKCSSTSYCVTSAYCQGGVCTAKKNPPGTCATGVQECLNAGLAANYCTGDPKKCLAKVDVTVACTVNANCKWAWGVGGSSLGESWDRSVRGGSRTTATPAEAERHMFCFNSACAYLRKIGESCDNNRIGFDGCDRLQGHGNSLCTSNVCTNPSPTPHPTPRPTPVTPSPTKGVYKPCGTNHNKKAGESCSQHCDCENESARGNARNAYKYTINGKSGGYESWKQMVASTNHFKYPKAYTPTGLENEDYTWGHGEKNTWCKWNDATGKIKTCQKEYKVGEIGCQGEGYQATVGAFPPKYGAPSTGRCNNQKVYVAVGTQKVAQNPCNLIGGQAVAFIAASQCTASAGTRAQSQDNKDCAKTSTWQCAPDSKGIPSMCFRSKLNDGVGYYGTGKCVAMKSIGEECTAPPGYTDTKNGEYTDSPLYHSQCQGGYCNQGICTQQLPAGSSCTRSVECGLNSRSQASDFPGACVNQTDVAGGFTCKPVCYAPLTNLNPMWIAGPPNGQIDKSFNAINLQCQDNQYCGRGRQIVNGPALSLAISQGISGDTATVRVSGFNEAKFKFCTAVVPFGTGMCLKSNTETDACAGSVDAGPTLQGSTNYLHARKMAKYIALHIPDGLGDCMTNRSTATCTLVDVHGRTLSNRASADQCVCRPYLKHGDICKDIRTGARDATNYQRQLHQGRRRAQALDGYVYDYQKQCKIGYCDPANGHMCTVKVVCTKDWECGQWKKCIGADQSLAGSLAFGTCVKKCEQLGTWKPSDGAGNEARNGMWCLQTRGMDEDAKVMCVAGACMDASGSTVQQKMTISSLSSINDYKGWVKKTYETAYGMELGIYNSTTKTYAQGCDVQSFASGRRGIEVQFTAAVTEALAASVKIKASAITGTSMVASLTKANALLGGAITVPSASTITASAPTITNHVQTWGNEENSVDESSLPLIPIAGAVLGLMILCFIVMSCKMSAAAVETNPEVGMVPPADIKGSQVPPTDSPTTLAAPDPSVNQPPSAPSDVSLKDPEEVAGIVPGASAVGA